MIKILDTNFIEVSVVEGYQSFIWTDRFNQYGDFELYAPMGTEWFYDIQIGYYLINDDSDRVMMIETVEITSDSENGDYIKVSGRSLEAILTRRIVWNQTSVSGNIQTCIKKLIDDSIINPVLAERRIDNFVFLETTEEAIINTSIESQYTGDNVYDVVADICQNAGCGFKVILVDGVFVFMLYLGVDRSGYITFSNEYNNLITSDYTNDYQNYSNVTLVAGEGEGASRTTVTVGTETGLTRRELYTDARDLRSTGLAAGVYQKQLQQRGLEKLAEVSVTEGFQGTVEPEVMYKYNEDFTIGDFVTFKDRYGNYGTPRIDEYVISDDENNGYYCYPTFVMVEG